MSDDQVKLCKKCTLFWPIEDFARRKGANGAVYRCSPCRHCRALRQAGYLAKNRARWNSYYREYMRHRRAAGKVTEVPAVRDPGYAKRQQYRQTFYAKPGNREKKRAQEKERRSTDSAKQVRRVKDKLRMFSKVLGVQ